MPFAVEHRGNRFVTLPLIVKDIYDALVELVSWYSLSPKDLLSFLLEQRLGHVPRRHVRAQIRKLSKIWKDVERIATKATKLSEGYLGQGQVSDLAMQIQNNARRLSRFFIEPVQKRPLEGEISDCKEAILSFLRKRGVRNTNEYGWILLRAIFGVAWKAGGGKDQIEAFRAIHEPRAKKIRNREDVLAAIRDAKLDLFTQKR